MLTPHSPLQVVDYDKETRTPGFLIISFNCFDFVFDQLMTKQHAPAIKSPPRSVVLQSDESDLGEISEVFQELLYSVESTGREITNTVIKHNRYVFIPSEGCKSLVDLIRAMQAVKRAAYGVPV